uniref:Uncharacterized protein n=1 Tax=Rhizophora mucronata TaxID=61149 RepID=A0A2P2QYG0_RHIMU
MFLEHDLGLKLVGWEQDLDAFGVAFLDGDLSFDTKLI